MPYYYSPSGKKYRKKPRCPLKESSTKKQTIKKKKKKTPPLVLPPKKTQRQQTEKKCSLPSGITKDSSIRTVISILQSLIKNERKRVQALYPLPQNLHKRWEDLQNQQRIALVTISKVFKESSQRFLDTNMGEIINKSMEFQLIFQNSLDKMG